VRPSLRFLLLVVAGWVGVRSVVVGRLPGASLFDARPSEAKAAPAIATTQFPPIEPLAGTDATPPELTQAAAPLGGGAEQRPVMVPVYYYGVQSVRVPLGPAQFQPGGPVYVGVQSVRVPLSPARQARRAALTAVLPEPERAIDPGYPEIDDFPMSRLAALAWPQHSSPVVTPGQSVPALPGNKIDRLQLTMWAYLRSPQVTSPPRPSLATGGMLGGSQAGARLFYNLNRQIAAVLRFSSDVSRRGGEAALGVRVQPLQSIPVWITAERRQAIGKYGDGRSAFAAFAEGGVYDRPLAGGFTLSGYAQAGVVGLKRRDMFADGGLTVTRPVYKRFSAGFGVWAGAQPGLYRVDVGPRVTMRVRDNIRVHFDYRQRVAGNALPGSGPAVTLAGDF
jgi:hypothetical protein